MATTLRGKPYEPLWTPKISLGDERVFLGFHDLMEVRVAGAFIRAGVSAIRVRSTITVAREVMITLIDG